MTIRECLFCLTWKCNLACTHCMVDKSRGGMSTEEIFEALLKIKEMGVRDLILMGGEPTMNEDFHDIIDFCLNTFENVTVETNGTSKTEFYRYPSCNVSVSFEYPDKLKNDEIRRFVGKKQSHFETAIKKIKVLHNPKILRFTLYQDTNIFKCLVMADMYGCNSVFFPLIPQGSGKSMIKKCPDAKKIAEALKLIEEFNQKSKFHHELQQPQTYLYNREIYLRFANEFKGRGRICQAGIRRIYIDFLGDVYPCSFVPKSMGNIVTDDISFINKNLLDFNAKMAQKQLAFPCSKCFYSSVCNAGCCAYHYNKPKKSQPNCPVNFLIKKYKEGA